MPLEDAEIEKLLNQYGGGTNAPSSLEGAQGQVPAYSQDSTEGLAARATGPLLGGNVDYGKFVSEMALQPGQAALRDLAARQEAEYRKKNEEPGFPLDIETGASPWERFSLAFKREKENQVRFLQNKYGEDKVRLDSEGDLIVRVPDQKTGKEKDLKVDERGLSAKDFIDILGAIPEVGGSIYAILKGRKADVNIPLLGNPSQWTGIKALQRDVLSGALGGETAGAIKDVVAGLSVGRAPDLADIAKERGKMAAYDVGLGEVTLGAGRLARFMGSPFHGFRGPVQFDALGAQQYWRNNASIDVPLTVGESTAFPIASHSEAFMQAGVGSKIPFEKFKKMQDEQLRKIQMVMMGNKNPPSDEELFQKMSHELQAIVRPAEAGVQQSMESLQSSATQGIEDIVSGLTAPAKEVYKSEVGKELRDAVIANRDKAKSVADVLYERVRNMPGGTGPTFDITGLARAARAILKKIPPEGAAKKMEDFAPADVIGRLEDLAGRTGKLSLSDLQQMRRDTLEAIPKTEGVPGRGAHYLGKIADAITDSIESNSASMPGGALKNALDAANKFYREQVVPFNRVGITDLFRSAEESGFISNAEIVSRLFQGGKAIHNYQMMRESLGSASPEFTRLKRLVADNIIDRSRSGDFINPGSFIENMNAFRGENREIADDIFGTKFADMIREAKALQFGELSSTQKSKLAMGGTVDKISGTEFRNLLNDPSPTVQKLRALIKSEAQRDRVYQNDILKSVADGTLPGKAINPSEFINRFVENAKLKDVQEVMKVFESQPQIIDDLRSKMVQKLFRDAERIPKGEDLAKLLSGDPTRIVSAISVFKQIEDETYRNKLKTVLGDDVFEDLTQYIKLVNASTDKFAQYAKAGGLSAGMQIAELTERGPLKFLTTSVKNWIVGTLMTQKNIRGWLSRVPVGKDPGAISLILTSPIFLQKVADEFPGSGGEKMVGMIKESIDKYVRDKMSAQQNQPKPMQPSQLMNDQEIQKLLKQYAPQ